MKPVLVLFATKEGHTEHIAERIVSALRAERLPATSLNVRLVGRALKLSNYGAAILAASVHVGRHEPEMTDFVARHRAELEQMPTAFLSVSLSEAGAERDETPAEVRAKNQADVQQMIDRFVEETGWHPQRIKPVAGALAYSRYNPFMRFVLRSIAKRQNGDTDTSHDYVYTDWQELDRFSKDFAAGLTQDTA